MRPNDIHEGDGILVLAQNKPQTEEMRTPEPGALEVYAAHILTVTKATPSTLEASTETNHEIVTLTATLNETTGEYDTPLVSITPTGYGDTETRTFNHAVAVAYPLGAPIRPGDPTPIHGCVVGAYGRFKSNTDDSTLKGVFTTVYKEAAVLSLGYGECIVALNDAYDNTIDTVDLVRNAQHFCDVLPLDATTHAALEYIQESQVFQRFKSLAQQVANTLGENHITEIMDTYVLDALDVARLDGKDPATFGATVLKRTHNGLNAELSQLLNMLEATEAHLKTFQALIKESINTLEESPLRDPNRVAAYESNL